MAFCKGIFVKDINSFFSYNFQDANLNPDRNEFLKFNDRLMANFALCQAEDYTIIKKLLAKIIEYYSDLSEKGENEVRETSPYECDLANGLIKEFQDTTEYRSHNRKYKAFLWKKAFEELFAQEILENGFEGVVLKTDYEAPDYLNETLKKYKVINLPKDWIEALRLAGVRTDKEVIPDYAEEKISTSLTLGYGAELWDTQRITLDSCQNHLPADSGGNNIFVRFQTTDGMWHDYREFEEFEDGEIKRIKISDDGRGYDYKSLGLFASIKGHQKSSGKWGEGLKMIAASAVRNGIKVELRSRNWMATPYTETEVLNKGKANEEEVQRLNFAVRIETKENVKALDDGDNPENDAHGYVKKNEQSSTTFINPTPELIKEFRNIKDNVLVFSAEKPMFSLDDVDVLDLWGSKLYVKNILIPGDHQTKYTYHLRNFDIETRDRDAIKKESMKQQIRKVLEKIEDERFIKIFLMEAANHAKESQKNSFLEFETYYNIPSCTEKADLWIKAFQEYFGEGACVRKMSSQDYSEVAQAQHMGLDTITLPDSIANTLLSLEGRDGKRLPSYKEALEEAIKMLFQ